MGIEIDDGPEPRKTSSLGNNLANRLGVLVLGVAVPVMASLSYSLGSHVALKGSKIVGCNPDSAGNLQVRMVNGQTDTLVNYSFSEGYSKLIPLDSARSLDYQALNEKLLEANGDIPRDSLLAEFSEGMDRIDQFYNSLEARSK